MLFTPKCTSCIQLHGGAIFWTVLVEPQNLLEVFFFLFGVIFFKKSRWFRKNICVFSISWNMGWTRSCLIGWPQGGIPRVHSHSMIFVKWMKKLLQFTDSGDFDRFSACFLPKNMRKTSKFTRKNHLFTMFHSSVHISHTLGIHPVVFVIKVSGKIRFRS